MVPPSARLMGGSSEMACEDAVARFGDFVEAVVQIAEAGGALGFEGRLQRGDLFERAAERQHVARIGDAHGDLGQQALDVENAAELLAQFGAQDGLLEQFADGIEAAFDFRAVERGTQQALAQQAAAHAGRGLIEDVEQRGVACARRRTAARRVRDCGR